MVDSSATGVYMTNKPDLPATLRVLRAKLTLTQEQLADRLGVSFATVNHAYEYLLRKFADGSGQSAG